jgi:SAM-dependent methyltransferase
MNLATNLQRLAHQAAFTFWPPRFGIKEIFRRYRRNWHFYGQYLKYSDLQALENIPQEKYFFPCLYDATDTTPIEAGYYYQDAWAFEKIVKSGVAHHIDVGSHHKLICLLSKIVPTTMVDIRPLPVHMDSLKFVEGSIVSLPYADQSVASLSSLCVVEHIGLGRYGDPFDANGTVKAVEELKRIVKPGGSLYISVPVDDENRIYFNAHRAFSEPYLEKLFAPFNIVERRYIFGNDFEDMIRPGFGTGCYHLLRPL